MADATDPGVTTPPVEATVETPPASESVTTPVVTQEQNVPYERFKEVNDRAKEAEERATRAEENVNNFMKRFQDPSEDEVEIEDDVKAILDTYVKKNGFVTKEQMEQAQKTAELNTQVASDVSSLTAQYKDSSVPYDNAKVIAYAKENGITITSKASLEATYFQANRDVILEAERKAAVTSFQETGKTGAEKPGSGGGTTTEQPEVHGIKARIQAARAKL